VQLVDSFVASKAARQAAGPAAEGGMCVQLVQLGGDETLLLLLAWAVREWVAGAWLGVERSLPVYHKMSARTRGSRLRPPRALPPPCLRPRQVRWDCEGSGDGKWEEGVTAPRWNHLQHRTSRAAFSTN
jgi:hypothetical protein